MWETESCFSEGSNYQTTRQQTEEKTKPDSKLPYVGTAEILDSLIIYILFNHSGILKIVENCKKLIKTGIINTPVGIKIRINHKHQFRGFS